MSTTNLLVNIPELFKYTELSKKAKTDIDKARLCDELIEVIINKKPNTIGPGF